MCHWAHRTSAPSVDPSSLRSCETLWPVVCVLDFAMDDVNGSVALIPTVDGESLLELVGAYEAGAGYYPADGYGGLLPAYFRLGDLMDYYRGIAKRQWPRKGRLWLLGCDCGEAGCWPLEAAVSVADATVTWSGFTQPHRPAWSYAGFGPFVFDRDQYEAAVAVAVAALGQEGTGR